MKAHAVMSLVASASVACLLASATSAAPAETPVQPQDDEVVVVGTRAQSDREVPQIIVGSRIPRRSLQLNPYIASSTSLGGLTPDSGVDAFKNSVTKRTVTCRAPGVDVTPKTACILMRINRSIAAGDLTAASAIVDALLSTGQPSPTVRFIAESYRYRIAEARKDRPGCRAALAAMTDSGLMGQADELAAVLTLASMAREAGDTTEAVRRFRQARQHAPSDTGVRVNLAALLLEVGQPAEARVFLREAIALAEGRGEPVPTAWRDNSR